MPRYFTTPFYANNARPVKLLIDAKANLEQRHGASVAAKQFPTRCTSAIMKDNAEIIKMLVDAGADKRRF